MKLLFILSTENYSLKVKKLIKRQDPSISIKAGPRSFTREWALSEDFEVREVQFKDGLLTIKLGKIDQNIMQGKIIFNG